MESRLKEKYRSEVVPHVMKELGLKNTMMVPRLSKICVNRGVGCATADNKMITTALSELSIICGQKAMASKSKKSISNFKLRSGVDIGCVVTLRGDIMYEFLDRLISIVLPRSRDFDGVSKSGFDSNGNYNLGIREQTIFPEINMNDVVKIIGMNISFVFSNNNNHNNKVNMAYAVLKEFGFPFRK